MSTLFSLSHFRSHTQIRTSFLLLFLEFTNFLGGLLPLLTLEKQIEEHEKATIQLKRARNSLLNVLALLPPEILGRIFHYNVILDGDFDWPSEGSYTFLLVCRHWFEVTSRTPEL